jgi:hypothetical protein
MVYLLVALSFFLKILHSIYVQLSCDNYDLYSLLLILEAFSLTVNVA